MSLYDSTSLYDASTLSFDGYAAPLANMPAVGVFIAWNGTPYEVDPTGGWTDVTAYVRQITIRRGRQDDLQQFPPGAAQLVLDNNLRYFDPFNTSAPAPFNGNLKPRKQIKIVANWNGTEYPLFRGFVAGWPVEYTEGGLDSTVTVDCFDLFGLLAAEVLDANPLFDYIQSFSPVMFLPFDNWRTISETLSGSVVTTRYIESKNYGTDALLYTNYYNYAPLQSCSPGYIWGRERPTTLDQEVLTQVDSIITSQNLRAINKTDAYISISTNDASDRGSSQSNTVAFWIKCEGNGATSLFTLSTSASTGVRQASASISAAGSLTFSFVSSNSTIQYNLLDNQPHFIVATTDSGGTTSLYLDGVNVTTAGTVSTTNGLGRTLSDMTFTGTGGQPHTLQHFAWFYDRVLTASEIAAMYKLGLPSRREPANTRLAAYLADANIPGGLTEIETAVDVTVDELPRIGDALLPEMQRIAASEVGEIFVDKTNVCKVYGDQYWARRPRCNTSQVTFTDTGTGVKYDASSIRMAFDADQVRNKFVVNTSFGGAVSSSDATSIATYGVAAQVLDTRLAYTDDAQTLTNQQVTIYKNPKMALDPFMSKGQQDPSYNWPRLLGLELLDRVTFKRTPSTGSAIVKDLLVQSIEHRITPGTWETVVNGSARYTNWFIVGVSLIGGDDLLLN